MFCSFMQLQYTTPETKLIRIIFNSTNMHLNDNMHLDDVVIRELALISYVHLKLCVIGRRNTITLNDKDLFYIINSNRYILKCFAEHC